MERKKRILIGIVLAAVLLSLMVAPISANVEVKNVEVAWECYDYVPNSLGTEFECTGPEIVYSYEYPTGIHEHFFTCIPVSRSIGRPYSELTEYACHFTICGDDATLRYVKRVVWGSDERGGMGYRSCREASSLKNYRTIRIHDTDTPNPRPDIQSPVAEYRGGHVWDTFYIPYEDQTTEETQSMEVKPIPAQPVTSTPSNVRVPPSAPTPWDKVKNICNGRRQEPTVSEVEWITYLQHVEDANPDMTRAQIIAALHYDQYEYDVYDNVPVIEQLIKIPLFQHGDETDGFKGVDLIVRNPPRFVKNSENIDIAHSYTALRSDLNRENTGWIDSIWTWVMRHANTDWGDWYQVPVEGKPYPDAQKKGNDIGHLLCGYYDKQENKDKPLSEAYIDYFSTH